MRVLQPVQARLHLELGIYARNHRPIYHIGLLNRNDTGPVVDLEGKT